MNKRNIIALAFVALVGLLIYFYPYSSQKVQEDSPTRLNNVSMGLSVSPTQNSKRVLLTYRGNSLSANNSIDFGDETFDSMTVDPNSNCESNTGCTPTFFVYHTYNSSGDYHVVVTDMEKRGQEEVEFEVGSATARVQ